MPESSSTSSPAANLDALRPSGHPSYGVIGAVSVVHLLNDMMQSVIVAIYPLLQGKFRLGFAQIGLITLTCQLTASLLQPVVGIGGNLGQALGPAPAAMVVLTYGRNHASWFGLGALLAIVILPQVSRWYRAHLEIGSRSTRRRKRRDSHRASFVARSASCWC